MGNWAWIELAPGNSSILNFQAGAARREARPALAARNEWKVRRRAREGARGLAGPGQAPKFLQTSFKSNSHLVVLHCELELESF